MFCFGKNYWNYFNVNVYDGLGFLEKKNKL